MLATWLRLVLAANVPVLKNAAALASKERRMSCTTKIAVPLFAQTVLRMSVENLRLAVIRLRAAQNALLGSPIGRTTQRAASTLAVLPRQRPEEALLKSERHRKSAVNYQPAMAAHPSLPSAQRVVHRTNTRSIAPATNRRNITSVTNGAQSARKC